MGLERAIAIAHQHTDGSVESICRRQVYFAVAVEIRGDDSEWAISYAVGHRRLECAIPIAQ